MSRSLRKFRIYNLGINQSNHIIQHSIIKENLEKQFFIQLKLKVTFLVEANLIKNCSL
jgi:hypothetical protein